MVLRREARAEQLKTTKLQRERKTVFVESFPYYLLANIGPIEKKYVLKAFAILLASVRVSPPTINLFGKDSLPPLRLINCLIPLYIAFT